MFGYASSEYDKHVYEEKLKDFLPDSFIDAHTHVYPASVMKNREPDYWPDRVAFENPIEDLKQTYADMFPDKKVTPVIFGNPKGDIAEGNEYCSRVSKREKLPALYLTHYNMSGEELERNVINGGFMGLKPYFCNARIGADPADADIFDFLPHEHLKLADKYGWVIMLHVSKRARLRDKSNVRQLMEIEQKYPNVKLIVAHVGRAYCEEDLGDAFDTLKKSEKMLRSGRRKKTDVRFGPAYNQNENVSGYRKRKLCKRRAEGALRRPFKRVAYEGNGRKKRYELYVRRVARI